MHDDTEETVDAGETHRYGGDDSLYDTDTRISGFTMLLRQFWALFVKRFHHTRRNRKAFVSQVKCVHSVFYLLTRLFNEENDRTRLVKIARTNASYLCDLGSNSGPYMWAQIWLVSKINK